MTLRIRYWAALSVVPLLLAFQNCSNGFKSPSLSSSSSTVNPPLESKVCSAPQVSAPSPDIFDCETGLAATGASEYGLSFNDKAVGNYAENSLSDKFLTAASQIASSPNGAIPATTHFLFPVNETYLLAKSKLCSRDMEVTYSAQNGLAFLRLTPEGNGIFFNANRNTDTAQIGVVFGFKQGVSYRYGDVGQFVVLKEVHLSTAIPNYNATVTDGTPFTFGAEGMEYYAKYNGVEFLRVRDYRNVNAGRAAFQTQTSDGFRGFSVKHLPNKVYLSDLRARILDMRDFGLKEIATTGSIDKGSNQLTLPLDAGFAVGDSVIIETGREAGQGLRGSVGVGGTWPALQYATVAEMNADTSKGNATYASVDQTVYVYYDGTWYQTDPVTQYYVAKIVPLALTAKVTALSNGGKTLTLDKTAFASVSAAKVYYDNAPILNGVMRRDLEGPVPTDAIVYLPPGHFALGQTVILASPRHRWRLEGAGQDQTVLFSPKGTEGATINVSQANSAELRNFHLIGNFGDNGYGFGAFPYPPGILFSLTQGGLAEDIKVTNVWKQALGTSFSNNVWGRRMTNDQTDPFRTYIQWMFQWSDSTGGGCVDCRVFNAWMAPGFESFRSTGVSFIRSYGENAAFSQNSAGQFLIEDAYLLVKAQSQFENSDVSFHHFNPIININSNIDNTSGSGGLVEKGGTIKNVVVIQEGPFDNRNSNLQAIIINFKNANIDVLGGYIQEPDYNPALNNLGAVAVNGEGDNTVVDGLRVVGKANPNAYPGGNIVIKSGAMSNCVADNAFIRGENIQKCKTNAEAGAPVPPPKPVIQGSPCVMQWPPKR